MKKNVYRIIFVLLLGLILLVSGGWFYTDTILDQFIRPKIENLASHALNGHVRIEQLLWQHNRLKIIDLEINSPDRLVITIPEIEAQFSVASLWQKHLDTLAVKAPRSRIMVSGEKQQEQGNQQFPVRLPFTVGELTISDAQIEIETPDQIWLFHSLDFAGSLQDNSPFTLSAYWGEGNTYPIALTGAINFYPQKNMTVSSFSWQQQNLLTSPVTINLATEKMTPSHCQFQISHFDAGKMKNLLSRLGIPDLFPTQLSFTLKNSKFDVTYSDARFAVDMNIESGNFGWDKIKGPFSQLDIKVKQTGKGWKIGGHFLGIADSKFKIDLFLDATNQLTFQAVADIPDPVAVGTMLTTRTLPTISGQLHLDLTGTVENNQLQLRADIQGAQGSKEKRGAFLDIGSLSGHLNYSRNNKTETYAIHLFHHFTPLLSLDGDWPRLDFSFSIASLETIRELLPEITIPTSLQAVNKLTAKGRLKQAVSGWESTIFTTADNVSLQKDITLSHIEGQSTVSISGHNTTIVIPSLSFQIAQGNDTTAEITLRGRGEQQKSKRFFQFEDLSISHINYMSADGLSGLGEGNIKLQGMIMQPRSDHSFSLSVSGKAVAAEVLAGEFYADLTPFSVDYTFEGEMNPITAGLSAHNIKIAIPKIGELTATATFADQGSHGKGTFAIADLNETYNQQLGSILEGINPLLTELKLNGKASLDYEFTKRQDNWQLHSVLSLAGLDVLWKHHDLKLYNVCGTIPLRFSSQGTPEKQPSSFGHLSLSSFSIGAISLAKKQLHFAATDNRLQIISPLLLNLANGEVAIKDFSAAWQSNGITGSANIDIANVDLEALTHELEMPVMQGRLNAKLGTLQYTDRKLNSDGLVHIEVFGGQFNFRNLHVDSPFSSYPTFYSNIDFSGLDLLQATRTFDFGEMNGILDGYIHKLQVFGTTPAQFEAVIATREHGKRNISVKALNNISIISQGGLSAALSRGVYQFIDFYRYKKIGFKCSLKNDTFTLLGTASPGSDKYLVYGGLLPPRIDITTTTPTISFKEMVNRLGRINRAGH